MNVDKAEAQLALTKAEEAWAAAKKAGKKDAAYKKAEAALIEARNEWRLNWRDSED